MEYIKPNIKVINAEVNLLTEWSVQVVDEEETNDFEYGGEAPSDIEAD